MTSRAVSPASVCGTTQHSPQTWLTFITFTKLTSFALFLSTTAIVEAFNLHFRPRVTRCLLACPTTSTGILWWSFAFKELPHSQKMKFNFDFTRDTRNESSKSQSYFSTDRRLQRFAVFFSFCSFSSRLSPSLQQKVAWKQICVLAIYNHKISRSERDAARREVLRFAEEFSLVCANYSPWHRQASVCER